MKKIIYYIKIEYLIISFFIVLGKTRTLNPQIRSLMLYPIKLQALLSNF